VTSAEITAPDDPRLDPFRAVRDRDLRGDHGRFIVESPRVVSRFLDAVQSGRCEAEAMVADPSVAPALLERSALLGIPAHVTTETILTEASGYRFHAGALAVGRRPRRPPRLDDLITDLPDHGPVLLGGLAGITSMDNIGGIFRTAAALGLDGLVLDARCCDPLLRRCLRISMGQVFRVPWAVVDDLTDAIDRLASTTHVESIAIENVAEAPAIHTAPLPDRAMLVIGNEGHGVPPELLGACRDVRRIVGPDDLPAAERPGGGDERSLNAHVAAAIAFHEAIRRRVGDRPDR
jgi:tRNA G18 (ribose-2'-O)-methylase SpoU